MLGRSPESSSVLRKTPKNSDRPAYELTPADVPATSLLYDAPSKQEFTLRWSPDDGGPVREIIRQQWNFSPAGSTVEVEEYAVSLTAVSVLELEIEPDMAAGKAVATLTSLRVP